MPTLLRFMTGHALVCVVVFIVPVLYGQVFQAQWWSDGVEPFISLVALLGFAAGRSLLGKAGHARKLYLVFLTGAFVVPYPFIGEAWFSLIGIFVVIAAGIYLFKNRAVMSYFEHGVSEHPAG